MDDRLAQYAESVVSCLSAPEQFKSKLKKDILKYIIQASGYTSVDNIFQKLGSPEELAASITNELYDSNSELLNKLAGRNTKFMNVSERSVYDYVPEVNCRRHRAKRYLGQYTREESEVNIKLLFIPLLQIQSGTERIVKPLFFDDDDDDDCCR